jgi:hypothetical protein
MSIVQTSPTYGALTPRPSTEAYKNASNTDRICEIEVGRVSVVVKIGVSAVAMKDPAIGKRRWLLH